MKKNLLLLPALLLVVAAQAQLPQNCSYDNRLLMMGDSWAQYMYDDNVHNEVLDAYGHADKSILSETYEISLFSSDPDPQGSYYAVSGSEARQWRDESTYAYMQNVRDQLITNPQIKLVILSLGGNDVLAGRSDCGWYKNMNFDPDLDFAGCGFTNETEFFDKLESDITWVIDQVLAVRPDIDVLISSYDYPNFNVTTSWIGCFGCDLCDFYACPKRVDLSYDLDGDGSISTGELVTDAEINQMMMNVELRRQAIANANPRVYYDNSMGLTQYYYGYAGIPSGATPYPGDAPNYTPGGDPNYPTDRDNFRLVDVPLWFDAPADPIHLSPATYSYKVKNQMDRVIFEKVRGLEDETNYLTVWSEGNNDGYVDILKNNAFNNGLRMGDEDTGWFGLDNDYRSILSFNTGSLPNNATITGASLYIIRSSEEDNPFLHTDRNPVMDIKSGYFGTSAGLEVADGTAPASAVNAGCFIGNATSNKRAIRIDVDASALQHINVFGKTQFRLYFDFADWSDEYINFYDGAGNAGLVPPSQAEKDHQPVYQYVLRKKTPLPDGTYTEEILEQSNELEPREGYVFEEHIIQRETDAHGVVIESLETLQVLEHAGLAKYMNDYQGAPAGGYAPFLDITYTIALPIELTKFEVIKSNNHASLNWTTASEARSKGFEIQYSPDAQNWTNIGWVAANGNSDRTNYYSFLHTETTSGYNYYRLKMVDESDEFEYTEVQNVYFDQPDNDIEVYPNPFTNYLNISPRRVTGQDMHIQLLNMFGQILYESNARGVSTIPTQRLPGGTYFVRIELPEGIKVVKVVKE